MNSIDVSYWILGRGMQHTTCQLDEDNCNIWCIVLSHIEKQILEQGYTLNNVSQIQMGACTETEGVCSI